MGGCCGQKGNDQYSQRDKRDKCPPIDTSMSSKKCVPGANSGQNRGKYVSGQHNEEVCHGTGERRRDLIDQLKIFLNEFDDKPCTVTPPQQGPGAMRQLGSYPEYRKKHCQSWIPPNPRPPPITSSPTHEIRATSDYDKLKDTANEYISFTDSTPKPPVSTCDCVKRNGLQDQCPHPMCTPPTAKCKANNPGPCCPPSLGLGGPEGALGGSKREGASGPYASNSRPQEPPNRSEYQDAFMYRPQGNEMQEQTPLTSYTTTYRQDFQDQSMGTQNQQQTRYQQQPNLALQLPVGSRGNLPPGMEMVCICNASSSNLQSGKKYLCCPLPL